MSAERLGKEKRYNLVIPMATFEEVQSVAKKRGISVVYIIRQFINLGLLATELQDRPDAAILIKEGDRTKELYIL